MTRYIISLAAYFAMLVVAYIITPLLPMFAVSRVGGLNNDDHQGEGLRLPEWLAWLDTPDNALTGDEAHAKRVGDPYAYWSMVRWLYRNPLYGFKWSVIGYPIYEHNLIVKHEDGVYSYFDAFQWRKQWMGKQRTFGWLLDAYYMRHNEQPKAIFVFWD